MRVVALLIAVASTFGCASSHSNASDAALPDDAVLPDGAAPPDGGTPGAEEPADPAAFFEARQRAECERARLCIVSALTPAPFPYADTASCMADSRRANAWWHRFHIEGVAAGRQRYDRSAASRCLPILRDTCISSTYACRDVFTGTLTEGSLCANSSDCLRTHYCEFGPTAPRACQGRCVPRSAVPGERTSVPLNCLAGPDEFSSGGGGECTGWREGPIAALGDPCGPFSTARGHWTRPRCARGLACKLRDNAFHCERPIVEGAPCYYGDLCEMGTFCTSHDPREQGVCVGGRFVHVADGVCDPASNPFAGPGCDPYLNLVCNQGGRCEPAGDGSDGAACTWGGPDSTGSCVPGLVCVAAGQQRQCRRALANGEPCTEHIACEGRLCAEGRCASRCY